MNEYLIYLSNSSGINDSKDIEDSFNALKDYGVVGEDDYIYLNDELNYGFLCKTIARLLDIDDDYLNSMKQKGYIDSNVKEDDLVYENKSIEIVSKLIRNINNKQFGFDYSYKYKDSVKDEKDSLEVGDVFFNDQKQVYEYVENIEDGQLKTREAEFEEVFTDFNIQDSYEVDFSNAEVIPLQEELDVGYVNNKFNLLASKSHVFNADGYRISYSLSTSGVDVHVSKKIDKTTVYVDASLNNVKPSFKWTYKDDDLKNCYMSMKLNTTTSLGATMGKYGNYYLKLKDKSSDDFLTSIKSMIVPKKDELEAIIPICEIKTPIPNVPFAKLNMTIGIKLYVSGKVELTIYNDHNIGFEIKNGKARFFYDHNDDVDGIVSSSSKAALALNLGLDAAKYRC